jgi:hypothetical protein
LVVQGVICSLMPAHTQLSYPRRRVSSTPRPIRSIIEVSGILDHPLSRVMTTGNDTTSRSRGSICPRLAIEFLCPPNRGRRECRVHAAPAVSCAICTSKCAHEHTGEAEASGIPCVMALRLMPRSPWRRIHLVTIVGGLRFCRPGWARENLRRLDTSNGRQNHTVLPYARTSFVCAPVNRSRSSTRPAAATRADALASTTSHPAFVTTRDRPSCRNGMAVVKPLIWGMREAEFCPSCQSVARRRANAMRR